MDEENFKSLTAVETIPDSMFSATLASGIDDGYISIMDRAYDFATPKRLNTETVLDSCFKIEKRLTELFNNYEIDKMEYDMLTEEVKNIESAILSYQDY